MKAVLLITLALVGFSYQLNLQKMLNDFEDAIDKEAKDCYGEFNLNRASLDEKLKLEKLPSDRNFKCFFDCVTTHLTIFDKDGNIVEDKAKKYMDIGDALEHEIYESCRDVKGADGCERFYEMAICARKFLNKYQD